MLNKKWKETLKKLGITALAVMMLAGSANVAPIPGSRVCAKEAADDSSDKGTESDTDSDEEGDKETGDKKDSKKDDGSKKDDNTSDPDDDISYESRVSSTSEFLIVGDCAPTVNGRYGQPVHLILPIYNMGFEMVTNLIVTPVTSTRVEEWPFQLTTTGLVQAVDNVPASPNKQIAYLNRREVEWDLIVSKDAPTGYYPLDFNVSYYRDNSIESTTLRMYVYIQGSAEAGSLDNSDTEKSSNPRIIVTGFDTEPKEVYAGTTFNLIIHLQNTSKSTAVSNILFDLEAAQEGKDEDATYAAFLPTSGSSTIFKDSIAPGASTDIEIEMDAKADLAQKPYVLDIKMDYEDSQKNSYSSSSNVSIPIKQVAKYDVSSFEVMPNSISVGSESNIMCSIYNTGRTTLYNVKVTFEADSVSGGDTFLGKIEPGGTGNVDAMLTGEQATMDDGKVKVILSYEDESGNVTTDEKELELFVTDDMGMEGDMNFDDMEHAEEENAGSSIGKTILIIVLVVVVLIIALIVFIKIRKKKKTEKALADE
ncbi:MAG: hypothetical protein J6P60_04820, partial [Lachnospiraceae bacterium]|nr:hypothetical protein [Lachnospiraceae bacterium]